MPDPSDLLPSAVTFASPVMKALIATSPVSPNDEVEVTIPSYDPNQRWGPCQFEAHIQNDGSVRLPVRMDECLVSFDEEREVQLIAWWHDDPTPSGPVVATGDLDGTYPGPSVDAELGASSNPWVNEASGECQYTSDFNMPKGNTLGTQNFKHRWIRNTSSTAGSKRLNLFYVSRDTINWQPGMPIIIEIFTVYYGGGGYTRSIVSGGYTMPLALDVVEAHGVFPMRPTLTGEVTIAGTIVESECMIDLPEYVMVVVKITYGHRNEVVRPFNAGGQFAWNIAESAAGAGQSVDKRYISSVQIVNQTITETQLASLLLDKLGISGGGVVRRGKSIIATEQSRTDTAYGLLTTADRVSGVVVPPDGLLLVKFSALVKSSVQSVGRATIFVGASQLIAASGVGAPSASEWNFGSAAADDYDWIFTFAGSGGSMGSISGVGNSSRTAGPLTVGGFAELEVPEGTYDVSIQWKSSSGSVTAKERKLWVESRGY